MRHEQVGSWRDAYGGNAGTDNPEKEEDEEPDNFTPEVVNVAVFQPRMNRAGTRKRVRLGGPRGTVEQSYTKGDHASVKILVTRSSTTIGSLLRMSIAIKTSTVMLCLP